MPSNFIYDNVTLNGSKENLNPLPDGVDSNKWMDADLDWNPTIQALNDTRGALLSNLFFGIQRQATAPALPVGGVNDFMWADNAGDLYWHKQGVGDLKLNAGGGTVTLVDTGLLSSVADSGTNVGISLDTVNTLSSSRHYLNVGNGGVPQWAFYTQGTGERTLGMQVFGAESRIYGSGPLTIADTPSEFSFLRLNSSSTTRLVAFFDLVVQSGLNTLVKSTQSNSAIALCLDVDTVGTWSDPEARIQRWQTGGFERFAMMASGIPRWVLAANAQLTVGVAGGASAPPASPSVYLKVQDSTGTTYVIPAYAA